jgi:hypothetical protein
VIGYLHGVGAADVVISELENRQLLHRMVLHKVRYAPPVHHDLCS